MKKKYINPTTLPDWSGMFSQVVTVEHQGLLFIHLSGQVGVDAHKNLTGNGSLKDQTKQAFSNLQMALLSANARCSDVVKMTIYVVNYRYEYASIIKDELEKHFQEGQLPALSLIGVDALADEQFLIEIDAEAVIEVGNKI
jgi:enamine deaminase RidA (YjgF/YER057c/UK114 family)